ncbi:hypothetical protein [Marinobacterium jannaschii]|uniref:hypothetical protein n=1 Tax=Marinobacterium jannaschii TaxID=64970 RepID=UPI0004823A6C|nr:hypothetical protein [Marinobacterium jannaschii]
MQITSANYLTLSQGSSTTRPAESGTPNQAESKTPINHKLSADGKMSLLEDTLKAKESDAEASRRVAENFDGKFRYRPSEDPERDARLDSILNRLSSEEEKSALYDIFVRSREDSEAAFFQLTEELSDEELRELVSVGTALLTVPFHGFDGEPRDYRGKNEAAKLINNLSDMDSDTRSRVLEKAADYAAKVPKTPVHPLTYSPLDGLDRINAKIAATSVFDLNTAINNSDDVNAMLDKLEQFEEPQQKKLLGLLRTDVELGDRMMEVLKDNNSEAHNAMLDYVVELNNIRGSKVDYDPLYETPQSLDFDNNGKGVLAGMVEDTVSLLEDYSFDDAQLTQMAEQLQQLDRSDQRAYLAISKTGFETLLGKPEGLAEPIDMSQHEEAVETVDSLRNNLLVRELVFESRMGEESIVEGERRYELKNLGEANRDMEEITRFLVTDAWLNNKIEDSSAHQAQTQRLIGKLSGMGAEQRDELVQDLNRQGQEQHPMAQLSAPALQETYGAFFDRTTSIANVDDLNALAEAEEETPPELRESFWQATELSGEKVDDLIAILDDNGPALREQIIVTLAEQASLTEAGEKDRDDVVEELEDLISYFSKDHTEKEKQVYLEHAF